MAKSINHRRNHHTAVVGGVVATIGLVLILFDLTDWPALLIRLAAVNATTFAMLGTDKA